jgi:hypothetical protein
LGSTTTCFSIGFIPLFLNILCIITIFKTIYDLMSNVATNMSRIPNMPLHFNILNSNLKNCKNMIFLSFDSTSFNIMICHMTICTIHSCFL